MIKEILPTPCNQCGCELWFEKSNKITKQRNYIYTTKRNKLEKYQYLCLDCFYNKHNKPDY